MLLGQTFQRRHPGRPEGRREAGRVSQNQAGYGAYQFHLNRGSGGEDRLTENITLNFSKVSLDYIPQDDKGASGTAIPMTWDIASNANQ
jgi:hypothetical protein